MMGDVILVNGRPWPVMRVKRRVYRFRILAAAVSRSFRFALDNGDPMTVVATDGGLMPRARQVDRLRPRTAERYEVLIDFRKYRPGQRVVLRNLSNDNNVDYDDTDKVMAFDVTDAPFSRRDGTWNRIPDLLDSPVMRLREADATRSRGSRAGPDGGQLDDQRPHLGGRHRQRLPAAQRRPEPQRRRDLGPHQGRRLVPSRPCAPGRLQNPAAATVGRPSTTSADPRTPPTSGRTRPCACLSGSVRTAVATWCTATTWCTKTTT